jgi:hypothetical protein
MSSRSVQLPAATPGGAASASSAAAAVHAEVRIASWALLGEELARDASELRVVRASSWY